MKHLILISLVLCGSLAFAQTDSFNLTNHLPERTLALVSFPNLGDSCEAAKETALGKIITEPQMKKFFAPFLQTFSPMLDQYLAPVEQQAGMPVPNLLKTFSGELTVALVDIDPQDRAMPLGALLALHFGENKSVIEKALVMAEEQGGIAFAKSTTVNGVDVYTSERAPLCYAIVDNTFVVSSKMPLLEETLNNRGEKHGALLKDESKFALSRSKVQGDGSAAMLLYINTKRAYRAAPIPPDVEQMMELAGAFEIKALAMGINFSGKSVTSGLFIHASEDRKGVLDLLDLDPVSFSVVENVPAHSITLTALNFDYNKLFAKVETILQGIAPDGSMLEQYKQGSKQLEEMIGFSIQNDLLGALGNTSYSFSYMPTEGGLLPRSIGVVEVKDQAKLEATLQKIAGLLGLEVKEMSFADQKIHYLLNKLGKLGNNPFEDMQSNDGSIEAVMATAGYSYSGISFMFADGNLYVAANPQDMKSYIAEKPQWQQNLSQNPDFKKVSQSVPEGASLVLYADSRPVFNAMWNTILPVLRSFEGFIRGAGIPLESALLPNATTISQHLVPNCYSYTSDKDGILLYAR